MEISNCEKEGFADNSVPDCDSKEKEEAVDCVMSEWQTLQECPDCRGGDTKLNRSLAATSNINNRI